MTGVFFDEINEKVIRLMADEPLRRKAEKICIKMPEDNVSEELFGTPVIVEITGYGNDGKNEGVVCRLQSPKPEMQKILKSVRRPTITLSLSEEGNYADTQNLEFKSFRIPYVCKGVFERCE